MGRLVGLEWRRQLQTAGTLLSPNRHGESFYRQNDAYHRDQHTWKLPV